MACVSDVARKNGRPHSARVRFVYVEGDVLRVTRACCWSGAALFGTTRQVLEMSGETFSVSHAFSHQIPRRAFAKPPWQPCIEVVLGIA